MPKHAVLRKETEASSKSSVPSLADSELAQTEQTEQAPDKEAIMKRLKAQGAVQVFPSMPSKLSTPSAQAEETESPEVESEEAPVSETASAAIAGPAASASASPSASPSAGAGIPAGETDPAFHARVQKMTDAANNPKWYDLPQHIENARHGEWDLSQSRERSGARKRDVDMEEDVRTNKIGNERAPGMFDVKQKEKYSNSYIIIYFNTARLLPSCYLPR